jgi:dihydroflavonol-4-reductase
MSAKPIVLVTGAASFIGKRIVLELLARGYAVRGTMRDRKRADEVTEAVRPHLKDAGVSLGQDLDFVVCDLLQDVGWGEAMEGVASVIHTASPFPFHTPSDPDEVIAPAVEGTRRVLRAAYVAGVGRVVLTSSGSAIMYGHEGASGVEHFDESHWSNLEDPALTPYNRSKTLAERAAWELAEETGLALAVINPTMVMGPLLDRHLSTSTQVVWRMLSGRVPAVPNSGVAIVDIRDVAEMHVNALANPASVGKRHFASSDFLMLREVARHLAATYPRARVSTLGAPDFLVRLAARFDGSVAQIVGELGIERVIDASAGRALLGHDFIDAREALTATAEGLFEHGVMRRP